MLENLRIQLHPGFNAGEHHIGSNVLGINEGPFAKRERVIGKYQRHRPLFPARPYPE